MPGRLSHTGLFFPSRLPVHEVEAKLRDFWGRFDYCVERVGIPKPLPGKQEIDRAGHGVRFWIFCGQDLILSYGPNLRSEGILDAIYSNYAQGLHVSLQATPNEYRRLRDDPDFERETDGWNHGVHSVFVRGPWGLEVEFEIRGLFLTEDTHG